MGLLEWVLKRKPLHPSQVDWKSIHKILVIRQHDQLGDFLLSTPVLRALRDRFPQAEISLLVRSYQEPVARNNRNLNDILVFQEVGYRWRPKSLWSFLRKLRSGFDLVVVLNTVSHSNTSDVLAWLTGARYILGSSHLRFPGTSRNFFYNLEVPYQDDGKHQSVKNLEIVSYLNVSTTNFREEITLLPEEQAWARRYLKKLKFTFDRPILGIHPGAGKIENRWPVEKFAETAERFGRKHGAQIAIFHGPSEKALADRLLKEVTVPAKIISDLTLREFAAVISQADLFLGNDTGTTHVAAAVGTPLVVIFGPTDPNQWKPWGAEFVAIRGIDERCESVSVEDVVTAGEQLLLKKGIALNQT
ncbi:MAG: glycosyltransferase family 9 protein [Calditrichaeota bacterium]|nr:glycosyltransferase family 9 protein [Calditrichota bacterium]